jgi:uncharacterized membrane protein YcaP (DUF421 family)
MESVLRAAIIYVGLLVVFRVIGNRTLGQLTTFDLILLLIISEAIQNGLVGESNSMTHALVLVLTLVGLDLALSFAKERSATLEKWIDGVPVILVDEGHLHHDRMRKERVDEADILTAARERHGLERMDQIKYAVLERSGGISIVPKEREAA